MRKVQLSEHGSFPELVRLHRPKNSIQYSNRSYHMRAFIEHDSFGPVAHRCIRDLGTIQHAIFGK